MLQLPNSLARTILWWLALINKAFFAMHVQAGSLCHYLTAQSNNRCLVITHTSISSLSNMLSCTQLVVETSIYIFIFRSETMHMHICRCALATMSRDFPFNLDVVTIL